MPYITSVEQIGYDRGQEVGAKRQAQSLILRQLTRKIGSLNDRTIDCINNLLIAQLEDLGEALFDFESIVDLDHWLSQHP